MPTRPVDQTTSEELDRILSVNVRGTFLCCKHAYPHLRQTRGNIVNISSMAGIHGEKSHAAYAASKGAINALTCSIAADWGADGIRCNAVCPSTVRTANSDLAIAQSEHAEQIHKLRRQISSLGAVAAPEQVATVVAFLASPQAGYVTGALIPVSGGSECGYGIKY